MRWPRVLSRSGRVWHGPPQPSEPAVAGTRQEERQMLHAALERLDEQSRTLLVLRHYSGVDSGEMGRMLGMPDSTVRSQPVSA
ncbi:MAG TPA: sigma-70 family RNA polymerase sigma factor [Planctomycetes bacterium]|nr:sigma-70 family RNA polymerase sigma factor [Planctomycetota bacterium]